jgi:hypothetical protein
MRKVPSISGYDAAVNLLLLFTNTRQQSSGNDLALS